MWWSELSSSVQPWLSAGSPTPTKNCCSMLSNWHQFCHDWKYKKMSITERHICNLMVNKIENIVSPLQLCAMLLQPPNWHYYCIMDVICKMRGRRQWPRRRNQVTRQLVPDILYPSTETTRTSTFWSTFSSPTHCKLCIHIKQNNILVCELWWMFNFEN